MKENMTDRLIDQYRREEYIARINRVIDYIESRIDGDLSLENLASIANFSKYHFHRIFRAMVGETLNHFIRRVRAEKAAAQLINNPKKSITEIALDCGFSGSASFSRTFRQIFGTTPSRWRSGGTFENSKIGKPHRKIGKDLKGPIPYVEDITFNPTRRMDMTTEINMEIKDMPELSVAYVRNIGPYKGDGELFESLFERLMKWAGPRGLCNFPETRFMAVYHDDPGVTEEEKLRLSACISVPADTPVEGEIGKMTVAGGKFAVARFELAGSDAYEGAWNRVMGEWLPESGFQPDDRLCYEIYHNNPREHPEGLHIVDICVPVRPL